MDRLAEALARAEEDPGALVGGQFLDGKSRDEIEVLLRDRGLPQSGPKEELVARLRGTLEK